MDLRKTGPEARWLADERGARARPELLREEAAHAAADQDRRRRLVDALERYQVVAERQFLQGVGSEGSCAGSDGA